MCLCSVMVKYRDTDSYLLDNHRLTTFRDRHSPICTLLPHNGTVTAVDAHHFLTLLRASG
jgi:hypothetical protein